MKPKAPRAWTITEDSARTYSPDPKPDQIKFDEKFKRFGLQIRRSEDGSEHRTYIFQYKVGPKHRRINCGKVGEVKAADARAAAERHAAALVNHEDPATKREVLRKEVAHTFGATVAKYLEAQQKKLRVRSFDASQRYLLSHWSPLHGLALGKITRAHVATEIGNIGKRSGPSAANRGRAVLSAFFRWAIGEGLCEENPVVNTNKQVEKGARERSLTDAEAAAVWLAMPESDYGRIVKLLLLTGCRRIEIGSLRWDEIDLAARTITLPRERTKNKQEHVIPLCDAAMAIIEAIPRRDRDCVFGRGQGGFGGWDKSKKVIDKTLQFKTPWTLHDIRRTVRTGMGMLGVLPHVAEAALNHLPPKLIRTYDRNTYATEKRAALDLWASHLKVAIAQASGANITMLRKSESQ